MIETRHVEARRV